MDVGDIIEVAVKQDLDGEECMNVFHYTVFDGGAPISDVANRFKLQVIDGEWDTLLNQALTFVEITVRNLFDDTERAVLPVGTNGIGVGEVLPPHDAAQATFATENPTITGSKRFSGFQETSQNGGKWVAATLTSIDNFLNNVLASPIIGVGGLPLYLYTIVKRIKYNTAEGTISYRLPENIAEAIASIVTAGVANDNVRTQKSRDFQE